MYFLAFRTFMTIVFRKVQQRLMGYVLSVQKKKQTPNQLRQNCFITSFTAHHHALSGLTALQVFPASGSFRKLLSLSIFNSMEVLLTARIYRTFLRKNKLTEEVEVCYYFFLAETDGE